jgi:hypothetical protein
LIFHIHKGPEPHGREEKSCEEEDDRPEEGSQEGACEEGAGQEEGCEEEVMQGAPVKRRPFFHGAPDTLAFGLNGALW